MTTVAVTETDVRVAINTIVDPCSRAAGAPTGLDDMGLIRELSIQNGVAGVEVDVSVGVTEYGCLMGPAFVTAVDEVLRALPGVASVQVRLDAVFDWMPEDMSDSYRAKLRDHRLEARRRLADRGHIRPAVNQGRTQRVRGENRK